MLKSECVTGAEQQAQPTLILIMGVSGSGKSTIAKLTARHFGFRYIDADDFHSSEAIDRMAQGIPLDDQIRTPWIGRINKAIRQLTSAGESCVLAFSGLKKIYRDQIYDIGVRKFCFLLYLDEAQLERRLTKRTAHFFNPKLLRSQLHTMEMPNPEENIITIGADKHPNDILNLINLEIGDFDYEG